MMKRFWIIFMAAFTLPAVLGYENCSTVFCCDMFCEGTTCPGVGLPTSDACYEYCNPPLPEGVTFTSLVVSPTYVDSCRPVQEDGSFILPPGTVINYGEGNIELANGANLYMDVPYGSMGPGVYIVGDSMILYGVDGKMSYTTPDGDTVIAEGTGGATVVLSYENGVIDITYDVSQGGTATITVGNCQVVVNRDELKTLNPAYNGKCSASGTALFDQNGIATAFIGEFGVSTINLQSLIEGRTPFCLAGSGEACYGSSEGGGEGGSEEEHGGSSEEWQCRSDSDCDEDTCVDDNTYRDFYCEAGACMFDDIGCGSDRCLADGTTFREFMCFEGGCSYVDEPGSHLCADVECNVDNDCPESRCIGNDYKHQFCGSDYKCRTEVEDDDPRCINPEADLKVFADGAYVDTLTRDILRLFLTTVAGEKQIKSITDLSIKIDADDSGITEADLMFSADRTTAETDLDLSSLDPHTKYDVYFGFTVTDMYDNSGRYSKTWTLPKLEYIRIPEVTIR